MSWRARRVVRHRLETCATCFGESDDAHGGAAGDFAGLGCGEVGLADEVGEHVDGRGEGLGGDEACAGVVDFLDGLHHGLEFGETGPLGELAGGCEHLAGEGFGGSCWVEEDAQGLAQGRVCEFRVEFGISLGSWGVACVGGDHAEKLHVGVGKARGKVGMYHEFARAGGQCAKKSARAWVVRGLEMDRREDTGTEDRASGTQGKDQCHPPFAQGGECVVAARSAEARRPPIGVAIEEMLHKGRLGGILCLFSCWCEVTGY